MSSPERGGGDVRKIAPEQVQLLVEREPLRHPFLAEEPPRAPAARMSELYLDLDALDAKLDAERARLVAALRRLADRLEALPFTRLTEPLTLLAASGRADALGRDGAGRRTREAVSDANTESVDRLPLFSNESICPACGNRREIRVHFDRTCNQATGDHYHRICRCGHEWIERCGDIEARMDRW